jgi:hypothetical protein
MSAQQKAKHPKYQTKLTTVSMSCRGIKIQTFVELPIINGKAVLPEPIKAEMETALGVTRGTTYKIG